MMDSGLDPREGIFPSLGLTVSWLLAVTKSQTFKYRTLSVTAGSLGIWDQFLSYRTV